MNRVIDKLPALVEEELQAANAIHPLFHSPHEGYAVLLEEVEETLECLENIRSSVKRLWGSIRVDSTPDAVANAACIELFATQTAAEAIQVAAMARKYQQSREEMERNAHDE